MLGVLSMQKSCAKACSIPSYIGSGVHINASTAGHASLQELECCQHDSTLPCQVQYTLRSWVHMHV